ncbi:Teichoic acid translocation permease protein TagG [compost metagenome]
MKHFSISPGAMVRSLVRNRSLVLELAWRETVGRYKGSVFGVFWSLIIPLLMLAIYTFVFSEIFVSRWGANVAPSKGTFAVILFAGLIVFNIFSECLVKAPNVVLSNVNFVKKVIFPLEILPCVTVLSALFHAVVSIGVLLAFEWVSMGSVPATALLAPLVMVPVVLLLLGLTWGLAAIGVYLRDVGQTVGIVVTGLMFVSPIFFPVSSFPERWRVLADLNPLTFPIEQMRSVLVMGRSLEWAGWTRYLVFTAVVGWAGFAAFQKSRKGFADVI